LVTEQQRGKGIGALLFERIIQEAKEKGFRRMVWQVLDWNEPALNFYKKYDAKLDPEWVNGTIDFIPA
jgi:GNAT superfamily N-acetyltransferase